MVAAVMNTPSDRTIAAVLDQHTEAIVITTDMIDGETNIGVATKIREFDSRLSEYLSRLLTNLNASLHEKHRRGQSQAQSIS